MKIVIYSPISYRILESKWPLRWIADGCWANLPNTVYRAKFVVPIAALLEIEFFWDVNSVSLGGISRLFGGM